MAEQARTAAVTDSLEFKAAVAAEVAKANAASIASAVQAEVAKIIGSLKDQGSDVSPSDKRFAETLAMAFAQLNEQGNGRKYVDPKILRQRSEAREKMRQLIIAARKNHQAAINAAVDRLGRVLTEAELTKISADHVPSYTVVAKTLLDDQVVQPFWVDSAHIMQSTAIDWPGVPNDAMRPLNEVAREIYGAFVESTGSRAESKNGVVPDVALDDQFGVIGNGLVVRNGAIPAYNRKSNEGRTMSEVGGQGLSLHHKNQSGRAVLKNVLGTIAEPAMQNI
jgi:hypothetical protein